MEPKIMTLEFEGGDGVGKNALALEVADQLMESGFDVVLANYPQYWSPFGTSVREMNRKNSEEFNYISELSPQRQAEIRCAMYALDRAVTLSMLISMNGEDTVLVLDRGPFSNAVTTAYASKNGLINNENSPIDTFINGIVNSLEPEMLQALDPIVVMCLAESSAIQNGAGTRKALDILEASTDVQTQIPEFYKLFLERSHQKSISITTKEGEQWKDKTEMAGTVIEQAGLSINVRNKRGALKVLGPSSFLRALQIEPNDQKIPQWDDLSINQDTDGQKKIILNDLEPEIAYTIAVNLPNTNFDIFEKFPQGKIAIKRLLSEYPELYEIISKKWGTNGTEFLMRIASL